MTLKCTSEGRPVTGLAMRCRQEFVEGKKGLCLAGEISRHAQDVFSAIDLLHVLHFPSFSRLSWTRNAVIFRINGKGRGFSKGNWIDPRAVTNLESSLEKAFTAEGVG